MSVQTSPRETSRRQLIRERWDVLALTGLLILGTVALILAGRRTGFYFDEWNFVQDRRAWTADALLLPHNEHLSLLPVLVYKLLFATVGISDYLPYRLCIIALHLLVVVLLFVYARRRVGSLIALLVAASLLFLGQAYIDIVWPFQIGYLGSLACALGALLALDRGDTRGAVIASVLLTGALYSSSLGIPLLAAVALELLGRPERRRLWPILIAPVVLYGLWYLNYSVGSSITRDNLFATPRYVGEAGAGAIGAIAGLDPTWGRTLLVGAAIALCWSVRNLVTVPWRLAALVVAPLAFWALTGLARANLNEPAASRYLYPGALMLMLVLVEAARSQRLRAPAAVLAVVLTGAAVLSNLGTLRSGVGFLRDQNTMLGGALAATEVAGTRVPPAFQPAPTVAPQVSAAPYLAAVRDLGSPAPPAASLPSLPEASKLAADDALFRGYALALAPVPRAAPGSAVPALVAAVAATASPSGGCLVVAPQGPGAAVTITVPPGGLTASGVGAVALRRWADGTRPELPVPAGAAAVELKIPRDDDPKPWTAQVSITAAARICAAG